jgi:hypothetical protein
MGKGRDGCASFEAHRAKLGPQSSVLHKPNTPKPCGGAQTRADMRAAYPYLLQRPGILFQLSVLLYACQGDAPGSDWMYAKGLIFGI